MKQILNIRLEEELKNLIELEAREEGITPSELSRNILSEYFDYHPEFSDKFIGVREIAIVEISTSSSVKSVISDLTNSVLWLLYASINNRNFSYEHLNENKVRLERLSKSIDLSNDLRFEFLKALNDINRVFFEGGQSQNLMFMHPNTMYTLNYQLLYAEVCRLISINYD